MNAPEDRLGKSVIAVVSAARPLSPHEQTFAGTFRATVSNRQQASPYSITSSATTSSPGGKLRPNALAVLRLATGTTPIAVRSVSALTSRPRPLSNEDPVYLPGGL